MTFALMYDEPASKFRKQVRDEEKKFYRDYGAQFTRYARAWEPMDEAFAPEKEMIRAISQGVVEAVEQTRKDVGWTVNRVADTVGAVQSTAEGIVREARQGWRRGLGRFGRIFE